MNKDTEKNKIRRYLNGTYMTSEVDKLHDSLCHSYTDGDLFDEVASEIWKESVEESQTTILDETDSYKEAQTLLSKLNHKKTISFKNFRYIAIGIAASLILLLVGTYGLHYRQNIPVQLAKVTTGFGERKKVMLADGSRIVLNACSSLQYPKEFKGDVRKVKLMGQAFFEVAREEDKPFFVETDKFDVQVLGTEFDVKSYADDEVSSVEVKSGKVEVSLPEAVLRLKKEEQIFMNTVSGEYNKKKGKKEVAPWRKGSLSFNHTPIRDVARELERIYSCKIKFNPDQDFANVITGEHDNQNLESVLESLQFVTGVKFRKETDGSIFLYK